MIFDFQAFAKVIAQEVAKQLRMAFDDVLDIEGAAKLLKLHPNTVRELAAQGDLPAARLGKVWRFRKSALLDHITDNAHQRGPEPVANAAD